MFPLTAIRPMTPATAAAPLAGTGAAGPIPQAELAKLTGGQGLGGLDTAQTLPTSIAAPATSGTTGPAGTSFSGMLENLISEVNQKQLGAAQTVQDMRSGQNVSLHQTMLALEEASVSFQLLVEVRNKVLDSYQELMRMQV